MAHQKDARQPLDARSQRMFGCRPVRKIGKMAVFRTHGFSTRGKNVEQMKKKRGKKSAFQRFFRILSFQIAVKTASWFSIFVHKIDYIEICDAKDA
jgi:hypothetical protein